MSENIVELSNLEVNFKIRQGFVNEYIKRDKKTVRAVDKINLNIGRGEIVSLVGESGSGKTMTVMSIINVLPKNAFIEDGSIIFNNGNISKLNNSEMKKIRGKKIFSIFQNPINCFNQSITMGNQLYDLISSNMDIKSYN